jgi:hypothetical protein
MSPEMIVKVTTVVKDQVLALRLKHIDGKYIATLYVDEDPVEVDYYGVPIDASTISDENFTESTSSQHSMREYIALALDITEKQAADILEKFVVGIKKEQKINDWCAERAKLESSREAGAESEPIETEGKEAEPEDVPEPESGAEPELVQTKPEEPEPEEPEEPDYMAMLKKYEVSENPDGNLESAKRFIRENLRDKQKDMAVAIIKQYVLSYFKLNKEFQILTSFQKGIFAEYKAEEKARKKEEEKAEKERKEAEKEAKRKAEEEATKAAKLAEKESKKQPSDQFNNPIVNEVENGLIASIEFEVNVYSFKTIYALDKWQTTLCLNGKLLATEEHESPMYIQDKKRDNSFAKRLMIEFDETGHAKYLKPIYALIDIINDNRDVLDALQEKAILEAEEEEQRKISEENQTACGHPNLKDGVC